ncbi:YihY/virulence factor BrkB family protein [Belnapia sp. T6]|uniref:YihY/virulence factor BrkB family protein n=1 Tax=Belnapia mucosa TaxID=2804532 RepID=A0ABS1V1X3_9PROT|nr:YihY/virulence factor BrkB family protein [Belnapia mucosa]MBL6455696.1 YihY/virulence factor BrkB family protein [Belnapia mucosa]
MPSQSQPNPILATFAAAGAALLLLTGRSGRVPQQVERRPDDAGSARRGAAAAGDRGHNAERPEQIPARGWWDILKRTAGQISEDRVLTEAAGITFYTLLALFPAIGALISIYGLFADPATIGEHLRAISVVVPEGGMQIIDEQVKRIVSKGGASLGFGAVLGIATSLWSANQAIKALVDALNVVYSEHERRGFIRRTAITLAFTLCGILFVLLAMAGVVVLPVALRFLGLEGGFMGTLLGLARWPVLVLAIGLLLAVLYRYGPSRDTAQWRWVSWGSAVAAFGFLAFSLGFSYYVTHFGNYNETYGSLGAVVGFMTWIWLSSTVVLAGAELDAEMEHQTSRDTTTGPERPMGARGAKMADTVA